MYSFVGSASSTATSGSSKTTSYSPIAGNTLFLPVYYNGTSPLTISSLKDQSNSPIPYTQAASLYDGASENGLVLLVVTSAPAGIAAISVALSGATASGIALGVYEYSSLSPIFDPTSTAVTATPSVAAGGTIFAPGITNTKQPAILFAMTLDFTHANQSASAGSGFTLRADSPIDTGGNTAFLEIEDRRVTTSGSSVAATFTSGSSVTDTWGTISVMLDEPAGAALAATPSDTTAASATLTNFEPPGWVSFAQWNVGMVGELERRVGITAPGLLKGPGVTNAAGVALALGTLVEIYPVNAGSSGNLTINDCASVADASSGNQIFTVTAADIVSGVPIDFPAPRHTFMLGFVVSSVPTGGEFGMLLDP